MILKFKTTGQPDKHYQFIDGVSNLIVSRGLRTDFNHKKNEDIDCWWEDVSVKTDESIYLMLEWADNYGSDRCFITHLPVFLLNDDGKTIERLI